MKTISITAKSIEVNPDSGLEFTVDLNVSDFEYVNIIEQFDVEDIVRNVGTRELLENMNESDIMEYLNSIGVRTEWEE